MLRTILELEERQKKRRREVAESLKLKPEELEWPALWDLERQRREAILAQHHQHDAEEEELVTGLTEEEAEEKHKFHDTCRKGWFEWFTQLNAGGKNDTAPDASDRVFHLQDAQAKHRLCVQYLQWHPPR
ncbi:MAG: hypothetical protein Q9162_006132 [Coniocarpon cinnabarinum]